MLKDKKKEEKRKGQRVSLPILISYRKKGVLKFHDALICKNISSEGIGALLPEPFEKNVKLEVLITFSGLPNSITALCRVVSCKKSKKQGFQIGLDFIKINDFKRFTNLLCDGALSILP